MYAPLTPAMKQKCGHGFTVYGLLPDLPELAEKRFFWSGNLAEFDLVVVALGAHWPLFGLGEIAWDLSRVLPSEKLVIIDGEDVPAFFPFAWRVLRRSPLLAFARFSRHLYFKRELAEGGLCYGLERVPRPLRAFIPLPRNARSIAFGIPKEKISRITAQQKTKEFCRHIVDPEIASQVAGSVYGELGAQRWAFDKEADYYADLRASRFGITTKRGGWDCLRHYEMAANGCVLCFKNLPDKPDSCAPLGLNPGNCIAYRDFADLSAQISQITPARYACLLKGTYDWIDQNTTEARALQFLATCGCDVSGL